MTGRVGARRSLSFPILSTDTGAALTRYDSASPLVIFRNLLSDNALIEKTLQSIGVKDNEVHGDLQVMLSAVRRMEKSVKTLIEIEEGLSPNTVAGRTSQ